ncbi:4-(cytidine 5'-diphospho)-2-C-methyl-D-erythritol kinase [Hydrogenimonas sp.]
MTIHAPAKVNIFLKITGVRGNYHELRSRFVRIDSLYDTITFVEKASPSDRFELRSSSPLPSNNTLFKAYTLLKERSPSVETFFKEYAVKLDKKIPQGAGLGGGSSDAAAFLHLCNEVCELGLDLPILASLGEKIGADVPFFIYGYPSANVEGIGEIITPFEENVPKLNLFTPAIHCDTAAVYRTFRERFATSIDPDAARSWKETKSEELLKNLDPIEANDLFEAALALYPELKQLRSPMQFFSGSGSTLFSKAT